MGCTKVLEGLPPNKYDCFYIGRSFLWLSLGLYKVGLKVGTEAYVPGLPNLVWDGWIPKCLQRGIGDYPRPD